MQVFKFIDKIDFVNASRLVKKFHSPNFRHNNDLDVDFDMFAFICKSIEHNFKNI